MNFVCTPSTIAKKLKQDGVQFAFCPKQSNTIEGVVLTRVCTCILGIFCPKKGQGFKLSAAHPPPNIGGVPPQENYIVVNTVFSLTFSALHWQDKMTSGQALLVKLAKLVKELLQKLPYWWKLPIVLMMFYQIRQRDYLLNNNLFDAYSSQLTGPKYDCQDPLIGKYYYIKHNFTQDYRRLKEKIQFNTYNYLPTDNLRTGRKEENRGNVVVYEGEEIGNWEF